MYLAPGAVGYASSMVLPGAGRADLPPVDEYVVEPETRTEMIDGRIVYVSPASPPHAALHAGLDYVLRAHVAPSYESTSDMLTRTSDRWNFAADAAVYKEGADPATGHRYLEELAFEVKHEQSWSKLTARATEAIADLRKAVEDMCDLLAIELTLARRARMEALDAPGLRELRDQIKASGPGTRKGPRAWGISGG